jgi:hypothetical protein
MFAEPWEQPTRRTRATPDRAHDSRGRARGPCRVTGGESSTLGLIFGLDLALRLSMGLAPRQHRQHVHGNSAEHVRTIYAGEPGRPFGEDGFAAGYDVFEANRRPAQLAQRRADHKEVVEASGRSVPQRRLDDRKMNVVRRPARVADSSAP